jgi:RNA polymerase sigma factor for flagellar operon FliA
MNPQVARQQAQRSYREQSRRPSQAERDALIREYLPLVKRIAYGILCRLPSDVDADDLLSAGAMGLIAAVERFDSKLGKSFEAFAKIRIRGAILDELRGLDHMSRGNRRRSRDIEKTAHQLEQELGRSAGDDEMARALGMSLKDYQETLEHTRQCVFLDVQDLGVESRDRCEEMRTILGEDRDGEPYDNVLMTQLKARVVRAIERLPDQLRIVMSLYYYSELNFKEIGRVLDLTESRICQLHRQAIERLQGDLCGTA